MKEFLDEVWRLLRGMWPYRWLAITVAWVTSLLGWFVVLLLPNVYEAKASFYVDANSRLREVVQQLGMEADVNSRVFLVRQAMLGRPQLEKVARDTDLTLRAATDEEYEELLLTLKDNVSISTGRSREAENLFAISYLDTDRNMGIKVVTALLDNFVESVIQVKHSDTERTETFLTSQLDYYRDLLEQTEGKLERFQRDNPGFANRERLGTFEQLQRQQAALRELESTRFIASRKRSELQRQLSNVDANALNADNAGDPGVFMVGSETSKQIADLQRRKFDLLLRYTPEHPDVLAVDEQIEILHARLREELAASSAQLGGDGATSATNPVYIEIQIALSNVNLQLAELEGQIEERNRLISDLEGTLSTAPELERQFTQLMRDYQQYRSLYDEVLLQAERERIGRVGAEQDVVTFNVIDPPASLFEPVAPPRTLLLVLALLAGMGLGLGTAFFMAQVRPSFLSAQYLEKFTQLPVLGSISWTQQTVDGRMRLISFGTIAVATISLVFVCGAVIFYQDTGGRLVRDLLTDHVLASNIADTLTHLAFA